MSAKIERSPQLTPSTRTASVARPKDAAAPTAPVTTTRDVPIAAFTEQSAARGLVPQARQLSTSADPSALWGASATPASELSRDAFAALTPAEQAKQLASVRGDRDQVGKEIEARVEQLDRKWKHSRLKTRTGALKQYEGEGKHLGRRHRGELKNLVVRSESAQKRIDELTARAEAMPKTPEAKKQMAAERAELARELRKARSELSAAVKAATELIDQEGLKVDRLAVTEQVIDPSAPKPGSGGSLLEKIARFFHLDSLCSVFFSLMQVTLDTSRKDSEASKETKQAEHDTRRERLRADERLFTELRTQEADSQARLASLVAQLRPAV